jgi:hypothetical protein
VTFMESTLLYELLAGERTAQYRRETEMDRRLMLLASARRPAGAAARTEGVRRGRRALAAAVLGVAGFSTFRSRKGAR